MSEHLNFANLNSKPRFSFYMRAWMFSPLIGIIFYFAFQAYQIKSEEIVEIENKISARKIEVTQEKQLREPQDETDEVAPEVNLKKYHQDIPIWSHSLKAVVDQVPPEVFIQLFSGDHESVNKLNIKGVATNYQSIIKFKNSLNDILSFKKVELLSSKEKDGAAHIQKNYEFHMICELSE